MNIQKNVPIAPLTTYKIGGNADFYCEIHETAEIPQLIEWAKKHDMPYFILGGGANTVFADAGFRGLLIHNKADNITIEGNNVTVDSGTMLAKVINEAKKHDLGGISKLTGLPGTIGGAIYGNAGAHGVEIGDFVENITLFDPEKGIIEENRDYFQFAYRKSILKKNNQVVLQIRLKLPPLDDADSSLEALKFRAGKQPKGITAGSFFKNPSKDKAAGYLIDQAGLKGETEGDFEISDLHANWLVNKGNGTQKDLVKLAKRIKETVEKHFNIELNPENILIDEHGNRIDI